MAANKKQEETKKEASSKAESTPKAEAPAPVPKPKPTHYFIKKSYPKGVQLGNLLIPYKAGQKLEDLALCYQLRQMGIELAETLQECDLFNLGDQ